MALTVTAAFNEFQRNIVNIDSSQTDRARASRDWLLGRMNTFPNNDVYFPIIYPDIHTGFGSFARRTKIGTVANRIIKSSFLFEQSLRGRKLYSPGAPRSEDDHNTRAKPDLCVTHASSLFL